MFENISFNFIIILNIFKNYFKKKHNQNMVRLHYKKFSSVELNIVKLAKKLK